MDKRLENEIKTARVMIGIFCRGRHGRSLCADCSALREYLEKRIAKCSHGGAKPTCAKCETHCFKPDMRDRIREVMRYAGRKMFFRHPVLTFRHVMKK